MMITKYIWENIVPSKFNLFGIWLVNYEAHKILLGLLLSIISIPLDLALVPLEIIAFIVMKILNK